MVIGSIRIRRCLLEWQHLKMRMSGGAIPWVSLHVNLPTPDPEGFIKALESSKQYSEQMFLQGMPNEIKR